MGEYTLPGVMKYLQREWQRNEKDRIQWELERAEMRARIARLEGENKSLKAHNSSQEKEIKMLMEALKSEDAKLPKLPPLDTSPLVEGRQYLSKCLEEVSYLLHPDVVDVDVDAKDREAAAREAVRETRDAREVPRVPVQEQPQQLIQASQTQTQTKSQLPTQTQSQTQTQPTTQTQAQSVPVLAAPLAQNGDATATSSWKLQHELTGNNALNMSSFESPTALLTASEDGLIKRWSLEKAKKHESKSHSTYTGHVGTVTAVVSSESSGMFYSAGVDKKVRFWQSDQVTELFHINAHNEGIVALDVSEDNFVLVSSSTDGTTKIWSIKTNEMLHSIEGPKRATQDENSDLSEDTFANKPVSASSVLLYKDGTKLVVGYENAHIYLIDVGSGMVTHKIEDAYNSEDNGVTCLAMVGGAQATTQELTLLAGFRDGVIRAFDLAGRLVWQVDAHKGAVSSISVDPTSGEMFASVGASLGVKIWTVGATEPVEQIACNSPATASSVTWTAGKQGSIWKGHIATCASDGVARVYSCLR
ncbi:Factor arrest protein 8 [Yarrowia sp. C11]|nr:Factor arrest protein 8 [Yarrowia sp. C11]KAG5371114.1 Factor arrest protein 8 [Yarrowia sp. E02]